MFGEPKNSSKAKWQAQLDDGLVEFSSISSLATVDELMAGFLKLAHGAHTEDQEGIKKTGNKKRGRGMDRKNHRDMRNVDEKPSS